MTRHLNGVSDMPSVVYLICHLLLSTLHYTATPAPTIHPATAIPQVFRVSKLISVSHFAWVETHHLLAHFVVKIPRAVSEKSAHSNKVTLLVIYNSTSTEFACTAGSGALADFNALEAST